MQSSILAQRPYLIRETVLLNGLTIRTLARKSYGVRMELAIKAGSMHDTIPGTAHFLEHMIARGGVKNGQHPSLRPLMVNFATSFTARTGHAMTLYQMEGMREGVVPMLGTLMRIVAGLMLNKCLVDDERKTIISEESLVRGRHRTMDTELKVLYPDSIAMRMTELAGPEASINLIQVEDIEAHFMRYYCYPNMLLSVIGDVSHDEVVSWVAQIVDGLPVLSRGSETPSLSRLECVRDKAVWYEFKTVTERAVLYWPTRESHHEDLVLKIGLRLLQHPEGILWPLIRGGSSNDYGFDWGVNYVWPAVYCWLDVVTPQKNHVKTGKKLVKGIAALQDGDFSDELFTIVKNEALYHTRLDEQGEKGVTCSELSGAWISGMGVWENKAQSVEGITKAEVVALAKEHFVNHNFISFREAK